LAAEDKVLYPQLQHGADAKVVETSNRFAREMGELGGAFMG
jgi:hypothetical protein